MEERSNNYKNQGKCINIFSLHLLNVITSPVTASMVHPAFESLHIKSKWNQSENTQYMICIKM